MGWQWRSVIEVDMKKSQGNLIVAILFLLCAFVNLMRVDVGNIQLSEIVIGGLWLLASLLTFWEYNKNKEKKQAQ
ncbi:MAG: hypothetical protein AAGJ18_04910 [Bacteroidota bacterium]